MKPKDFLHDEPEKSFFCVTFKFPFYLLTRELPGECSGDIFRTLDFPPSGNTLIFSNEGVKNLKPLNYIYSIRKELIEKSKTCGPPPILGATVDTNISSI